VTKKNNQISKTSIKTLFLIILLFSIIQNINAIDLEEDNWWDGGVFFRFCQQSAKKLCTISSRLPDSCSFALALQS
jgi:hypothetical protein